MWSKLYVNGDIVRRCQGNRRDHSEITQTTLWALEEPVDSPEATGLPSIEWAKESSTVEQQGMTRQGFPPENRPKNVLWQ